MLNTTSAVLLSPLFKMEQNYLIVFHYKKVVPSNSHTQLFSPVMVCVGKSDNLELLKRGVSKTRFSSSNDSIAASEL